MLRKAGGRGAMAPLPSRPTDQGRRDQGQSPWELATVVTVRPMVLMSRPLSAFRCPRRIGGLPLGLHAKQTPQGEQPEPPPPVDAHDS